VLSEIDFFDEGIGPKRPEELIFAKQPAGVLNKEREGIKGLGGKQDRRTGPGEPALGGIEAEGAELVERAQSSHSEAFKEKLRIIHRLQKTGRSAYCKVRGTLRPLRLHLRKPNAADCIQGLGELQWEDLPAFYE
jgi:hypothetical protein